MASTTAIISSTQQSILAHESTPKAIATCRKCQRSYGGPDLTTGIVPMPSSDGARLYLYACDCGGKIILMQRNGMLAQVRNPDASLVEPSAFRQAADILGSAVAAHDQARAHFRAAKAASSLSGQALRSNLPNPDPDRRKGMRPSTADVVARDNHAIISSTDAVIARLAASFGCHVGGKKDSDGFLRKLGATCQSLLDAISDAHSKAGEMECACYSVLSGEVAVDEATCSALSGGEMQSMLSGLYRSLDSASTDLFGCPVSAIKAVSK